MSAQLIKELRDRTGAGFLDCKKALEASNNDVEAAIAWLQERGAAKAAKKAGAIAAEGVIGYKANGNTSVIFEVNSQTDFVADNDQFLALVEKIGNALVNADFSNAEEANAVTVDGKTIAELCLEETAIIGEKIVLRRAEKVTLQDGEALGAYVHVNKKVGAVLVTQGGTEEADRNVAMHIASMNPQFLDESSVPASDLEAMKAEIADSEVLKSKPENIRENIAKGMLSKKLSEVTLVDQEFVMDKMPVKKYLANAGGVAKKMIRFEVGEGIEKNETDFAAEVAAQMAAK